MVWFKYNYNKWMHSFEISLGYESVNQSTFSTALHWKCTSVNSFIPQWNLKRMHSILQYFPWSVIVHGTVPCNMKWMYKCTKYYFEAFSSGILYLSTKKSQVCSRISKLIVSKVEITKVHLVSHTWIICFVYEGWYLMGRILYFYSTY